MTKTITITDPMQVKIGDKAYFKNCDFGFDVIDANRSDTYLPFEVMTPLSGSGCWAQSSRFDHATREVEEPKWPDPPNLKLHIYIGADGKRYIYNPCSEEDTETWSVEGYFAYYSRETMGAYHRDALPHTELELIPKESES